MHIMMDIIVMHVAGIYYCSEYSLVDLGAYGSLCSNATIENIYSFALFRCAFVSFAYLICVDPYFWVLVLEAYPAGGCLAKA